MKQYLLPSVKLTLVLILLCGVYFGLITLIAKLSPGQGNGLTVQSKGRIVGYSLIGQNFTDDRYFWGRPSSVNYNASGSGGSNKGPSNAEYLQTVSDRIDSFLSHNPTVRKDQLPSELVTASGSGLDPNISPDAAFIQMARVAKARKMKEETLRDLVKLHTEVHWLAPDVINVLKLNIALDSVNTAR